jgi:rubrerythrin
VARVGRERVSYMSHQRDDGKTIETPITGKNGNRTERSKATERQEQTGGREMLCPACGHPMPDLKGGKASICPVCGFKDSCCY